MRSRDWVKTWWQAAALPEPLLGREEDGEALGHGPGLVQALEVDGAAGHLPEVRFAQVLHVLHGRSHQSVAVHVDTVHHFRLFSFR